MVKRKTTRHKRPQAALSRFEGVLLAAAVVVGVLVVSLLAGRALAGKGLVSSLRPLAWMAVGVLLLGLYLVVSGKWRRTSSTVAHVKRTRYKRRRRSAQALRAVPSAQDDLASLRASTTFVPVPPRNMWCPEVFDDIEWRRFEAVCEALFAQAGFETRPVSHGADGGVDLWLHSRNAQGPAAVVRCKHWHGKPVGEKELREFHAEMVAHQLQRGTYASTSTFTPEAAQFAAANGINAMDGAALLALIARRMPAQQKALLAVAYEGDYWRPTCALCGVQMTERTPSRGGADFWGCVNYPRCLARLPMNATRSGG